MDEETEFERALLQQRIGGKYVVDRIIGRGGMGFVALGRHEQLGQQVAIKFMLASAAGHEALQSRFLREAQLAAQLRSDHVVRVFDVGKLDNGLPYTVMEYLEGASLADELEARTRLPVSVAVDYVLQALEAIAEAHSIGVVHRDLKPDNLFLARARGASRTVKVLDFGISKTPVGADENLSLTQTSAVLGSPLYMSPEQIRASKSVDARADIWSLGVVLYQLVEGVLPFDGESIGELFGKIQYGDPPAMRHAPPALAAIVSKCLARDPAQRFPSVRELADGLQPFTSEIAERSLQVIHQVLTPAAAPPRVVAVARGYSDPPPELPLAHQKTLALGAVSNEVEVAPRARGRGSLAALALLVLAGVVVTTLLAVRRASPLPVAARASAEAQATSPVAPPVGAPTPTPSPNDAPAARPTASVSAGAVAHVPRTELARKPASSVSPPASASAPVRRPAPVDSEPDRGF